MKIFGEVAKSGLYRAYCNHATMHEESDTIYRTLPKESSRGYRLTFDSDGSLHAEVPPEHKESSRDNYLMFDSDASFHAELPPDPKWIEMHQLDLELSATGNIIRALLPCTPV
jgi:hypothetical protein